MSLSERNITFRVQDAWGEQRLGDLSANSFASKQCMQEQKDDSMDLRIFYSVLFDLQGREKEGNFAMR